MGEPTWTKTRVVLERGGPWEVLPEDRDFFRRHAEAYVTSETMHPEAKARVRRVWLEGKGHEPGWQEFKPVPAAFKLERSAPPPHRTELAPQLPGPSGLDEDDAPFG